MDVSLFKPDRSVTPSRVLQRRAVVGDRVGESWMTHYRALMLHPRRNPLLRLDQVRAGVGMDVEGRSLNEVLSWFQQLH